MTRVSENEDFKPAEWTFPKNSMITIISHTAAMDKTVWSSGGDGDPHPPDKFWAERFLIYPHEIKSGPSSINPLDRKEEQATDASAAEADKLSQDPIFSMQGLSTGWIPYGGGSRMCPGRHFAKQEILITIAILFTTFDIELRTPADFVPKPDMHYFPWGTLPPAGQIPFSIRRRERGG